MAAEDRSRSAACSGNNNAPSSSYTLSMQTVKLDPHRAIRAELLSSEHSARQRETLKAAALPTELLPPERKVYQAFLADLANERATAVGWSLGPAPRATRSGARSKWSDQ